MTTADQPDPGPLALIVGVILTVLTLPWWLLRALIWASRRHVRVLLLTWALFATGGLAAGRYLLPAPSPDSTAAPQTHGKPCGDGWIARDKTCRKEGP